MNKIRCSTLKEPDLWMNAVYFEKKKKSPYLLTHRWNGGSGAGNEHISKGGLNKLIKISYNWTLSEVQFIQVFGLFRFLFIQISL